MPILSERVMRTVARRVHAKCGVATRYMDVGGVIRGARDALAVLTNTRRRRSYALQQGLNLGAPYVLEAAPGVVTWVAPLEDSRMVLGGAVGGEVFAGDEGPGRDEAVAYLVSQGMAEPDAASFVTRLPAMSRERIDDAAGELFRVFYDVSGWRPVLMAENRQRLRQEQQISDALREQREAGGDALYPFEKERVLLANIRAGDRNSARRILNEMLTSVYMSSPGLPVLRARAIELLSCLTRAAIEDNPLMEPLIHRNHRWTENLVAATSFESISQSLMTALDEFVDGVYLHGVNRLNVHVHRAIEHIGESYAEPISLTAVAGHVGLSAGRLAHLVKQYTGRTTVDIINGVRVRHAQDLLTRTAKSCTDIAYEVGFCDQSHFTKQFKKHTGTTPARYRHERALR